MEDVLISGAGLGAEKGETKVTTEKKVEDSHYFETEIVEKRKKVEEIAFKNEEEKLYFNTADTDEDDKQIEVEEKVVPKSKNRKALQKKFEELPPEVVAKK